MVLDDVIQIQPEGSVVISPDAVDSVVNYLSKANKCDGMNETVLRIRKQTRTKIRIPTFPSGQLLSVPPKYIDGWIKSIGIDPIAGQKSNVDLAKGQYEGGFKVWESTHDLINFITQDRQTISRIFHGKDKLKVLELGSGCSLASLAFLNRLLNDSEAPSEFKLHLQDYNWQVLASFALINFSINLQVGHLKSLLEEGRLRFFHGDWRNFKTSSKYHLIMMSEALYDSDNYPALHDLLERHARKSGYIVIATKNTYFGLSGGLHEWMNYVEERKTLEQVELIKVTTMNIPRSILIMRRISGRD